MAITLTTRANVETGYNTALSSVAYTPAASKLAIAVLITKSGSTAQSITGHGTWTALANQTQGSHKMFVWAMITSASPVSDTVDASWSSNGRAQLIVEEFDSTEVNSVADALNATNVDINGFYNNGAGPFDNSLALAAFGDAGNTTFIVGRQATGATGFTQQTVNTSSSDTVTTYFKNSSDTAPTFQSTGTPENLIGFACEIVASGGGGGSIIPLIMHHRQQMRN